MNKISKEELNSYSLKTFKRVHLFFISFTLFLFFSPPSNATVFRNSYISFKLPPNWNCQRAGTEWICKDSKQKTPYEAIIVLTAKERDHKMDNLKAYETYLKKTRRLSTRKGTQTSIVNHVRRVNFGQHTWLDAMHLHGEIASHYTRYLVTTYNQIAVLLSFSVQKEAYIKYNRLFSNVMKSMKLLSPEDSFKSMPRYQVGSRSNSRERLGLRRNAIGREGEFDEELSSEAPSSQKNLGFIFFVVVLLGGLAYFLLTHRKKT